MTKYYRSAIILFVLSILIVGASFAFEDNAFASSPSEAELSKKSDVKIIDASKYSVSNGFLVENKKLNFDKTIRNGTCSGIISYPYLTHDGEQIFMEINDEIHDFAEIYAICNQDARQHYHVKYEIPESGTREFFSVVWYTSKDGEIWRVDALSFDRHQGDLVRLSQIFNLAADSMLHTLAEISAGHIKDGISWEEFQEKITARDVQIFIDNHKWMIAFNPTYSLDKLVLKEIPKFLLLGDDVTDAR